MKKIAMLQPNYIPWKGVFDLINRVDIFVFYDDVQYTKRDWRNRNKIKTKDGDVWLSVPVTSSRSSLICDVGIDNSRKWQKSHYQTIYNNYNKSPFFNDYKYILEELYLNRTWEKLADLDIFATKLIAKALGVEAQWEVSSKLGLSGSKDGEKVVKICHHLNADYFINGPASKNFMNEELFNENNIELDYIEYNYEEYKQQFEGFSHYVTVLDVLFNCGRQAKKYILPMGTK